MGRFLEPPKELPSTKDDNDSEHVEQVGLADTKDTSSHELFANASGHRRVAGLSSSDGERAVRGIAAANEPDLVVISGPAAAATTGHGSERDGSRGARAGSESDSDGEDDEVRRSHTYRPIFSPCSEAGSNQIVRTPATLHV